jgi:hypothetical protein
MHIYGCWKYVCVGGNRREAMYSNVTLRHVSITTVAVEKCYICECVFVALDIYHKLRVCHIVNCGLSGYTIFFHIISYRARRLENT